MNPGQLYRVDNNDVYVFTSYFTKDTAAIGKIAMLLQNINSHLDTKGIRKLTLLCIDGHIAIGVVNKESQALVP